MKSPPPFFFSEFANTSFEMLKLKLSQGSLFFYFLTSNCFQERVSAVSSMSVIQGKVEALNRIAVGNKGTWTVSLMLSFTYITPVLKVTTLASAKDFNV